MGSDMRQPLASWAGRAVLLIAVVLVFAPEVIRAQEPPVSPPSSPQEQTGPQTGPGQPSTTQATPSAQTTPSETQTPGGAQPIDPFAGSPLLQMFERQPDVPSPIRQLRFAPALAEPTPLNVRLFLTAEEEFTDNADQTKNNRRSEFRTRLVPGIAARADRPWAILNLSYAPEIVFRRNSVGDTEVNQSLSGRAALWPTGPFQLSLADDFTDSHDFSDAQDPGSRRTGKTSFLTNTATVEAAYVLPRLRTALAYTNIINHEQEPTSDTRVAHTVRPNVLYTDPRFSVGGGFAVTRGNENSSVEIPYWGYEGDARYLHVVTPTISAGVSGGYQYQEPDQETDSVRRFSIGRGRAIGRVGVGPDGNLLVEAGADVFARQDESTKVRPGILASYTHRFLAFAITARYEQGYRARFEEVDNSGVTFTRSAGIFLTSSYFRDLTATLGFQYEENKFQDTTLLGAPAGTTDRTYSVTAELRYLLVRWLFLTAGYTGTFRISTQDADEFNENRVRVGVTYQYNLF